MLISCPQLSCRVRLALRPTSACSRQGLNQNGRRTNAYQPNITRTCTCTHEVREGVRRRRCCCMSLNPRAGQNKPDNLEWCRRLRRTSARKEKKDHASCVAHSLSGQFDAADRPVACSGLKRSTERIEGALRL